MTKKCEYKKISVNKLLSQSKTLQFNSLKKKEEKI